MSSSTYVIYNTPRAADSHFILVQQFQCTDILSKLVASHDKGIQILCQTLNHSLRTFDALLGAFMSNECDLCVLYTQYYNTQFQPSL